jgi:hypothetical protein
MFHSIENCYKTIVESLLPSLIPSEIPSDKIAATVSDRIKSEMMGKIAAIEKTIALLSPRLDRAFEILEIDDDGHTPDDLDDEEDEDDDEEESKVINAETLAPIFEDDDETATDLYISQSMIAKMIGVNPVTIARWLENKNAPREKSKEAYDRLFREYRHDGKGWLKNQRT